MVQYLVQTHGLTEFRQCVPLSEMAAH